MKLSLLLLIGAVALVSGCDSGTNDTGGGTEPGALSCAERGLDAGTMTLTTPSGTFQGVCSEANIVGTQVEVTFRNAENASVDESVQLLIRNFTAGATRVVAGTYVISPATTDDLDGNVTYYRGQTRLEAESGSIVVSTITSSRISGTVSFEVSTGSAFTGGRFDASL